MKLEIHLTSMALAKKEQMLRKESKEYSVISIPGTIPKVSDQENKNYAKKAKLRRRNSVAGKPGVNLLSEEADRFKENFGDYTLKEDSKDFVNGIGSGKVNHIAILLSENDKNNEGQSENNHKRVKDLLNRRGSSFNKKTSGSKIFSEADRGDKSYKTFLNGIRDDEIKERKNLYNPDTKEK